MLWACLLPSPTSASLPTARDDELRGLAIWGLQFTPRVAVLRDAVVMEVEGSARLFGGRRALRSRIDTESRELGVERVAWAPVALAGLALARAGVEDGVSRALSELLDAQPLHVLEAVEAHGLTLSRIGCKTLGDVRALPRGGITRRFGAPMLAELDRAYGIRPEVHEWQLVPETFHSRLELMARVEMAPALLFGARRLVVQMCGWLSARHCGTTAFVLRWAHDTMRSRQSGAGGELVVRTAKAMRDVEHLCRLLAEQLAKVQLLAPAGELEVEALDVQPLEEKSASFLPDTVNEAESLALTLERVAARLGPERVLRPRLAEDHRLEWTQHWAPASERAARPTLRHSRFAQPTFMLAEPLRLAAKRDGPLYQGPLQLLAGPHRVEGGWWHRVGDEGQQVVRDYWVAFSAHAGVLWVYQERLTGRDEDAWYLQGSFA